MPSDYQLQSPIIGISSHLLTIESGNFTGCERIAVGKNYVQAISQAGAIPLILPIIQGIESIKQQMGLIDGLVLSGGNDVCPLQYGEEPHKGLEAICSERDAYEIELIRLARQLGKPILGICRGLQLINVAFGGTLYQDISQALPHAIQHQSKAKPSEATHTVLVFPHTLLHQVMEESLILTNSFHHQAIKDLAPCLRVNAQAKDGVIEGIESTTDHFILAVQWHPELMIDKHYNMLKLFDVFVEAVKVRRNKS